MCTLLWIWAFPAVMWKYRTIAVTFGSGTSEKTTHIYDPNIFRWWSKAATFEFAAVMKCLFGWNTFSAVKTIYAYTSTARFIVRQDVSVFLICISNLNAASHTCGESPITHKKGGLHSQNPPFALLTPHDFLQSSSFSNSASTISCLIVIDAFDGVRPPPTFTSKQIPQGHKPPSSEEKSHKQHAPLLLLCIKAMEGEPKHGVQWEQQ